MALVLKKIACISVTSALIVVPVSKIFLDFESPIDLYRYNTHLSYRKLLEKRLSELKKTKKSAAWNVKNESLNKKPEILQNIKDRTVKIERTCNSFTHSKISSGTGWFFDYEIREGGKYPLKWFLATNAHVIGDHTFKDNPYGQKLPFALSEEVDCYYDGISLYRWDHGGWDEKLFLKNEIDFDDPDVWSDEEIKKIFDDAEQKSFSKDVKSGERQWNRRKDVPLLKIKIRDPKLFYVAIDFLEDGKYKDFSVLEINFDNEIEARRMTENIYSQKRKFNFVSQPDKDKEYFSAGYPSNSFNPYKIFGNYSLSKKSEAVSLSCVNSSSLRIDDVFKWGNKKYAIQGCYYMFDNFKLGQGASGSLVSDSSGKILGLYTLGTKDHNSAFVEPIRYKSSYCSQENCRGFVEYDLINGSNHQKGSYKEQVLKYDLNTYLRKENSWSKPS